jgi:peroxiredoxin Q/BCP
MTKAIDTGDMAPDFELPTDGDGQFKLSAHRGHPVIVFFYPKDDTSGCTIEAIDFTAMKPDFDAIDAQIVGMSPDNPASHDKFKAKHKLAVTLASDEDKGVLEAYGVWREKSMYGRKYMGVERSTFLIDSRGRVAQAWRKVKVPGHVSEVLAAARGIAG